MQKEKEQFWREHEERAGERKKQKQKDEEEVFARESDKDEQIEQKENYRLGCDIAPRNFAPFGRS